MRSGCRRRAAGSTSVPEAAVGWRAAATIYLRPRLLLVFFLGVLSGLPLALTGATLTIWLAEAGVSKAAIGAFSLVGIAYTFKFAWSPLLDRLPLPGLTARLGRRRGWLLATQALLVVAMLGLGLGDPHANAAGIALWAVLLAFASASQDIVIDAYRVELLEEAEYGAGASMVVFGYRVGMLLSGAGALLLAQHAGWFAAYAVMAAVIVAGMLLVLAAPEPAVPAEAAEAVPGRPDGVGAWLERAVWSPLAEFASRPGWWLVLLFVLLYKLGDALAGVMTSPLYVELGFTKDEIAAVVKLYGFWATLLGAFLGGIGVARWGITPSLFAFGALQLLSNLMFAALARSGHDLWMLAATIGLENLTGAMGTTAFVAYLSRLTNVAFTATQYALLSSLTAVGRTMAAAPGGLLAERLDWVGYFGFTAAAALPGLLLLVLLVRRYPAGGSLRKAGPGSREPIEEAP